MPKLLNLILSGATFAAPFTLSLPVQAQTPPTDHTHVTASAPAGTVKAAQTRDALRDLWLGHAFWVRAVVAETMGSNAAAAAAAEKEAVGNARQLADALAMFYGAPAGTEAFDLLAGHYAAVKQYLIATKASDFKRQEFARQAMLKNAKDISIFLGRANPHLPSDAVQGMLMAHGGHHLQQIHQVAARQYAEEARTWGDMKSHMYAIADAMSDALVKQFPSKFQ